MKIAITLLFVLTLSLLYGQDFIEDQFVIGGGWSDNPTKVIHADGKMFFMFRGGSGPDTGNLNYIDEGFFGPFTLMVCTDANCNSIWQRGYGGFGPATPRDIIDVGDGLVMAMRAAVIQGTGNKTSPLFMDTVNQDSPYGDYWIVKIDYDGNILWQETFGSYQEDVPNSLTLAENGNILISGYSFQADPGLSTNISGNKTEPSKSKGDIWAILIN